MGMQREIQDGRPVREGEMKRDLILIDLYLLKLILNKLSCKLKYAY